MQKKKDKQSTNKHYMHGLATTLEVLSLVLNAEKL